MGGLRSQAKVVTAGRDLGRQVLCKGQPIQKQVCMGHPFPRLRVQGAHLCSFVQSNKTF